MSDIKLTADTEIDLSSGGAELATGIDAISQDLKARFQMVKGEWFRNADAGFPWFEKVFIKGPDLALLKALFRSVILGTPGIDRLDDLVLDFTGSMRNLTIRAVCYSEGLGPFIYDEPLVIE